MPPELLHCWKLGVLKHFHLYLRKALCAGSNLTGANTSVEMHRFVCMTRQMRTPRCKLPAFSAVGTFNGGEHQNYMWAASLTNAAIDTIKSVHKQGSMLFIHILLQLSCSLRNPISTLSHTLVVVLARKCLQSLYVIWQLLYGDTNNTATRAQLADASLWQPVYDLLDTVKAHYLHQHMPRALEYAPASYCVTEGHESKNKISRHALNRSNMRHASRDVLMAHSTHDLLLTVISGGRLADDSIPGAEFVTLARKFVAAGHLPNMDEKTICSSSMMQFRR